MQIINAEVPKKVQEGSLECGGDFMEKEKETMIKERYDFDIWKNKGHILNRRQHKQK